MPVALNIFGDKNGEITLNEVENIKPSPIDISMLTSDSTNTDTNSINNNNNIMVTSSSLSNNLSSQLNDLTGGNNIALGK